VSDSVEFWLMLQQQFLAMPAERAYVPAMPPAQLTADELLHLRVPNKRVELVRGVLVVREPAGLRHGEIVMELSRRLANHVAAHALGKVYAAETGFTLARGPDTVRAPDVAFIKSDRVPKPAPAGFPNLAPDLAVEVLSPDDRPADVLAEVADWLSAGTRLVWVIDPERRLARVYRADGTESGVAEAVVLEGEDVVPGFTCPFSDLL
jgi:Uma2 family endonuclease